ncbi:MAG: beta-1,3-glucanase family protein, partial [Parachlamydiaceae bacterium]
MKKALCAIAIILSHVLYGIVPPAPPTPDLIANYIPITIYNGTTSALVNGTAQPITDDQIYIFIQTKGGSSVLQFTSDGSGHMLGTTLTPVPIPGNSASFYSSFYSYPLSTFPSAAAGFYTLYIPTNIELPSSRIYFSLINPIKWIVNPSSGGFYSQDSNLSASDSTYYTLYDKVEFTVTNAALPFWQLVMNSTMVDYYCLPLSFYINYENNAQNITSYTGLSPTFSRQDVFSTYQTALSTLPGSGAGTWDTLYTTYTSPNGALSRLRIASANTAALKPTATDPIFPAGYLTSNPNSTCQWFNRLWTNDESAPAAYYDVNGANHTITLNLTNAGANAGTATGCVDGCRNFVFTLGSDSQWYPGSVIFQAPLTISSFFSGDYTNYVDPDTNQPGWSVSRGATTETVKAIWQVLSCAFNVGLLPPSGTTGTPEAPLTKAWMQSQVSNFFNDNANLCTGPWFNFYSQVLHTKLMASPYLNYYTAPFDDYLGIDGTITVNDTLGANAGAAVNITIGDMTDSIIPNIFDDSTIYNVIFAPLPAGVTNVTFNGTSVPSDGGGMGTASGSSMIVALQYTTGAYSTTPVTTFTAQISPGTATMTPPMPCGANVVLSGGDVTIYLGEAGEKDAKIVFVHRECLLKTDLDL